MASGGSLLVLHESDYANLQEKDNTRNLGLQTIVNREDATVAELINDAQQQSSIADESVQLVTRLQTIISNLIWVANKIYEVIQDAYMASTSKTQKFIDLQTKAREFR